MGKPLIIIAATAAAVISFVLNFWYQLERFCIP